jgi:hypothetical protein
MSYDFSDGGVLNDGTYQKPSLFVKGVELFLQNGPSITPPSRNVYLRFQSFYDEERLVCGL